jgi:hypothetical protein
MPFVLIEVMHSTLFHIPYFSGGYINWIRSYLSHVCVSGILSSPFEVLSGIPQGSGLGPLHFIVFINALYDAITCSKYLIFLMISESTGP